MAGEQYEVIESSVYKEENKYYNGQFMLSTFGLAWLVPFNHFWFWVGKL